MGLDVTTTELKWDDATPLSYEEALEHAIRHFADTGEPVDVAFWRNGDLEVGFIAILRGVGSYDGGAPAIVMLEFDRGCVVLSREEFESAAWLEQPGPMRVDRGLRFSMSDREIELTDP